MKKAIACKNGCGKEFIPRDATHVHCSNACRYQWHYRNDLVEFELEKRLRRNVRILKKLLRHRYYLDNRINWAFLDYEGFDFTISTQISEIPVQGEPPRIITWSHNYGIEVVATKQESDGEHRWVTIHVNLKTV